jgi:hypothetical protein
MLCRGRQFYRAGGQNGERRFIVAAVLGKVEVRHGRVPALEKLLHRRIRFGELGPKRRTDFDPERFEEGSRKVIGGAAAAKSVEHVARRCSYRCVVQVAVRMRADGGAVPRGEIAK